MIKILQVKLILYKTRHKQNSAPASRLMGYLFWQKLVGGLVHVNTSPNLSNRICKEDNQSHFSNGRKKNRDSPGDPKPPVTSQTPQKVSIQITLYQRLQKKSKRKHRLNLLFKRVSSLKNKSLLSFSPLPYYGALNLEDIDGNFSGEIVMSSAVLDHPAGYAMLTLQRAII